VAPIEEAGGDGDAVYKWLRKLDGERDRHETTRLAYVAATRARERLHLLGQVGVDSVTRESREPDADTLLASLWPAVEAHFKEHAASVVHTSRQRRRVAAEARIEERVFPNQELRRLAADWKHIDSLPPLFWPALADERGAVQEVEFSWAGETARHVGSVVHRWLQRMADDALAGWDEQRIERARTSVRKELSARGIRQIDLDDAVERTLAALRRTIKDERGRWILGPHPRAASEHRVTAFVDGAVRRMVVDRLFEDESGRRWIVDYKTSTHEGAGVESFLDRERVRYATQLARYARALGGVDRCGLYFPLLENGWREVEAR
jgi:ATP-dependent exoDNAse (exonuclease V) beta subunit